MLVWRLSNLQSSTHRNLRHSEQDASVSETVRAPRAAIVGLGKMGSILVQAFCRQKVLHPDDIAATVNHAERAGVLSSKYGIEVTTDNRAAIRDADVILLCVKPQTLGDVVREIETISSPTNC